MAGNGSPFISFNPLTLDPNYVPPGIITVHITATGKPNARAFPSAPLQPIDLHQFSRMNQIMGIIDSYGWDCMAFGIAFQRLVAPRFGFPVNEDKVAKSIPRARICLAEIERIAGDDEFLAGERVSLACLGRTPEGPGLLEPHAKLRAWAGRMEARQSVQVTRPPGV